MSYQETEIGKMIQDGKLREVATSLRVSFEEFGTRRAVADNYGVSEATVTRWIKIVVAAGWKDPRQEAGARTYVSLSPAKRRELRAVVAKGKISQKAVAERFGISTVQVRRICRESA